MKILGLDLGSNTGFALQATNYPMACGTWKLHKYFEMAVWKRSRVDRTGDPRIFRLKERLDTLHQTLGLDWIVYEDVLFSSTSAQTQLWASFRTVVWLMAEKGVRIECVPVGTLKLFATGSGAAKKEDMMRALVRKFPGRFRHVDRKNRRGLVDKSTGQELDDNAADAVHLLEWAKATVCNIQVPQPPILPFDAIHIAGE